MATEYDPAEKFQDYAHPHMLVSTEWLEKHLDDSDVVIVESDEDVLLYETGHIPGAVKVDWHTDLQDPVARDYLDAEPGPPNDPPGPPAPPPRWLHALLAFCSSVATRPLETRR